MEDFKVGEYIIYVNGDKYELGRIKSITSDGAFVAYHEGETGAKTPFDLMHKLVNAYCIKETTLGGEFFMRVKNYKMPDDRMVIFRFDENGVGKVTVEAMDVLMEMIGAKEIDDNKGE